MIFDPCSDINTRSDLTYSIRIFSEPTKIIFFHQLTNTQTFPENVCTTRDNMNSTFVIFNI